MSVPAAANSLQLEWPEPWGCGAPVTGYLVDMARADAVLAVQGPPTPPQVPPATSIDSEAVSLFGKERQPAPSALMETQGWCQSRSCSLACSWHGYHRLFQDSLMDGREGSEALRRAHGSSVHCRRAPAMHW